MISAQLQINSIKFKQNYPLGSGLRSIFQGDRSYVPR